MVACLRAKVLHDSNRNEKYPDYSRELVHN